MKSLEQEINDHIEVIKNLKKLSNKIEKITQQIVSTFQAGNKLLICGNGGSASDAQHIAGEFIGRFRKNRQPLGAIALNTDTSVITCVGNDFGFNKIFERQVAALGNVGDCLLVISTSGNSENLILAAQTAKKLGLTVVFFGGRDGGQLKEFTDISLIVPSDDTARIQEAHILAAHLICGKVELEFADG